MGHAPARFAYATGVYEPDKGGAFGVGISAKDLAAELDYLNPMALRTAFEKAIRVPDPSMPGTERALVKGKTVFKFKESFTLNAALAHSVGASPVAAMGASAALVAHQT